MRYNLQNKTLRVGVNVNPPLLFLRKDDNKEEWKTSGGIEVKLLDTLKDYFNFSYQIINCNSNWGSKLPNNSWNGLIGMLETEKLDLGLGGTTLNYHRSRVVPFLYPHLVSSVTFITPAAKIRPNFYLVFKPLDIEVWLSLTLSLLVCLLFDYIYKRLSKSWVKVFWISMYSLFRQQYYSVIPATHYSLNVWRTFWSIGTFVLTSAYASCLCSLITIPTEMNTIDTVEELVQASKSSQIVITGIGNSAYFEGFKDSKVSSYAQIGRVLQPVKSKEDGFLTVKNSPVPHAFISARDSLRYGQLIYGEEYIHLAPENADAVFFPDLAAIPVRRSFQYIAPFNQIISRVISAGLLDFWKLQEYFKIRKIKTVAKTYSDFSLVQLQSFFYIYIVSVLIALVFFLWELFLHLIIKKLIT